MQCDMRRQLQSDGVPVVLMHLDDGSLHQKVQRVPNHLSRKRERLEALLVHEVETISVPVQVRRLNRLQVRLLESLTGLKRLVKNRACQKVPHLQAYQRLPAPGRGRGNLSLQTQIRSVFNLEKHLALYVDGINQCGHDFLNIISSKRA